MAKNAKEKIIKRQRRARRIKARILNIKKKTSGKIRLTVFRSNKHIYTQLIDNDSKKTIAAAQDKEITEKDLESAIKEKKLSSKIAMAYLVGKLIAEKSMKKKIKEIVFDRRGYKYHGRIKALADGAREQGLKF